MKVLIVLAVALLLPLAGGCGRASAVAQSDNTSGRVDTSLPPEHQAKQEAVRKMLRGFQTGTLVPGVAVQGRTGQILDDASKATSWEFAGPPKGDEVPVVFHFDKQGSSPASSKNPKQVERVFLVTGGGDLFKITRK
jgi:hypothetical protein